MVNFYVAYMLRLWQAEEAGRPVWRASLECPRTGKLLYFISLAGLVQFLEGGGKMPETHDTGPSETGSTRTEEAVSPAAGSGAAGSPAAGS